MRKNGLAFAEGMRTFFRSPYYIALVAVLMVLANLFGLELLVFYLYLFFGIMIALFESDLRGIIPIACCSYMTISAKNNPAVYPTDSAFYSPSFKIGLLIVILLAAALLAARLISLLIAGERKPVPKLTIGFLALGLSFVLGGIFSSYYSLKTAFFGFTVFASLSGLYFLFYYGVDFQKADKSYFAQVFLAIGAGLLIEILGMYLNSGILKDPTLDRGVLITGWGMYNNVGCALAMCVPSVLYFSLTQKRGYLFTLLGVLFAIGLVATQSRGAILFGGIVYVSGEIYVLVKSEKRARLLHLAVLFGAFFVGLVLVLVFREQFLSMISAVIEATQNSDPSNGRMEIYRNGFKQFLKAPFFGVGFYECHGPRWGNLSENAFLPPRYHDTYVQLLASGGIFAFVCYFLHRAETIVLLFKKASVEKVFIALSVSALVLTSIVDCHFFNMGPGLLYSVLLVCAEGLSQEIK